MSTESRNGRMTQPFPYASFDSIGTNTVHLRVGNDGPDAEPHFRDAQIDGEPFGAPGRRAAFFRMGDGSRYEISERQYTAWTRHRS